MANNDPKRDDDKMDEFRRALTHGRSQPAAEPGEGSRDPIQAAIGDAADRSSTGGTAPKRESELDDFREALTQGRSQMPSEPGESTFKAALGNVADRSSSWVSEQVHQGLQGFVNHVLLGGSSSPELADKHQEHEHDKGMDR
ncbi:MAG: hypothetical protein ABTD50_23955 [Polyangiaceae bacterium]|jgi:hypothetical protein